MSHLALIKEASHQFVLVDETMYSSAMLSDARSVKWKGTYGDLEVWEQSDAVWLHTPRFSQALCLRKPPEGVRSFVLNHSRLQELLTLMFGGREGSREERAEKIPWTFLARWGFVPLG